MRLIPMLAVIISAATPLSIAQAEETQSKLDLYKVERIATSVSVSIAGTVAANKSVQLTAQMPGRISTIAGEEGDRFNANSILVSMDDTALLAKMDAAMANRDAAGAAIRNAQAQLDRERYSPRSNSSGSAPGGMGMPSMMDQMFSAPMQDMMGWRDQDAERYSDLVGAETRLAQATTNFKAADANIAELHAVLRDTKSIAPFDGVIEKVYVEVGDTIQPGQPILDFSETANYKVEADMPVRLSNTLRVGQHLPVKMDGAGPEVKATVTRIHPVADRRLHTIRVELSLPVGTMATTGQYAEISVTDTSTSSSQLAIPTTAIIRKGGLPLIFGVGEDGTARLRVIRIGDDANGNMQPVLSGIHEGDLIVASPPPGFRAGAQVVESTPAPAEKSAEQPAE